jgi:hypothetical protein
MNKAVIALTVATVASASASTYLWRELGSEREQSAALQTRVAELERERARPASAALQPERAPTQPATEEVAAAAPSSPAKPAAAQASVLQSMPNAGFVATQSFGPADPNMRRRMMEAQEQQARMLKDPEYRELMRAQQKLGMMRMYGDLEPMLGLTKEESERLLDVLAEQSIRAMEQRPGFGPLDGTQPSEAELRERQRAFEEQHRRNEQEIAAVLGSRYSDWQEYQKNSWSRSQVTQLRQTLSSTDEPLRQDQIKPLVEAIAREQQQMAAVPMRMGPGRRTPSGAMQMDPQTQARMAEEWLERTAQSHERIRNAVSGLLTPAQFEQLQRQQEQELKMQELSVKQQRARADAIARGEISPDSNSMNAIVTYGR